MQIQQKDFDKLKQLDRIEYRQKQTKIEKYYEMGFWSFIYYYIIIGLMTAFTSLILKNMGDKIYIGLAKVSIIIMEIGLLFLILNIFLGVVYHIIEKKKLKELEEQYFTLEVKK